MAKPLSREERENTMRVPQIMANKQWAEEPETILLRYEATVVKYEKAAVELRRALWALLDDIDDPFGLVSAILHTSEREARALYDATDWLEDGDGEAAE